MTAPNLDHKRTHPAKARALAAIQKHLEETGGKNWRVIIEQFSGEVGEATMWRWIQIARKSDAPRPSLAAAKVRVEQAFDVPENTDPIGRELPVAPSPNYIAKSGERGMRNLDMMVELDAIYADAKKLREFAIAVTKNEETGEETEKIKNPVFFEKQMMRRLNVIDTAIKAMGEIWNLRTMQDFYEVVVQEIGRADPETQQRIMQRLAALNAKTGMSMNMRI